MSEINEQLALIDEKIAFYEKECLQIFLDKIQAEIRIKETIKQLLEQKQKILITKSIPEESGDGG